MDPPNIEYSSTCIELPSNLHLHRENERPDGLSPSPQSEKFQSASESNARISVKGVEGFDFFKHVVSLDLDIHISGTRDLEDKEGEGSGKLDLFKVLLRYKK